MVDAKKGERETSPAPSQKGRTRVAPEEEKRELRTQK